MAERYALGIFLGTTEKGRDEVVRACVTYYDSEHQQFRREVIESFPIEDRSYDWDTKIYRFETKDTGGTEQRTTYWLRKRAKKAKGKYTRLGLVKDEKDVKKGNRLLYYVINNIVEDGDKVHLTEKLSAPIEEKKSVGEGVYQVKTTKGEYILVQTGW